MANIPIRDIPGAVVASPDPSNLIPMDNGSLMQKTTIANAVNTTLPLSSQAEAEAGANNAKRMSPLRTKQAIDAQVPGIVNSAITALSLGTMSQEDASDYTPTSGLAAVALSNSYTDLSDLPTLGTAAATDASDYATAAQGSLADTSIQPGDAALVPSGGTIGQVLVKNSGTNYDTGWVSSAAATAVSYAPQTLTDAQQEQARSNISAPLRGRIYGLTLSNNTTDATNDIDITAGEAASDAAAPRLMVLGSALTKRLDAAWAAGTGNGGLDTGEIANTTYHVWLIQRSDTGVVDALLSTSATSPTMPTSYDRKRRIGSIIREAGAIRLFDQDGDRFLWRSPALDRDSTSALSSSLVTLTAPTGIQVNPLIVSYLRSGASSVIDVSVGSASAGSASLVLQTSNDAAGVSTTIESLITNTSAQIYMSVVIVAGSSITVQRTRTYGYIDRRDR